MLVQRFSFTSLVDRKGNISYISGINIPVFSVLKRHKYTVLSLPRGWSTKDGGGVWILNITDIVTNANIQQHPLTLLIFAV